jgi:hypothetical protein
MVIALSEFIRLSTLRLSDVAIVLNASKDSNTLEQWKNDPDQYRIGQGFQSLVLDKPTHEKKLLMKYGIWMCFSRNPDSHTLTGVYNVLSGPQFHHKSATGSEVYHFSLRDIPQWDHLLGRVVIKMPLSAYCRPWVRPADDLVTPIMVAIE